jgi:glucose/mannose-6-phosphate isomerase
MSISNNLMLNKKIIDEYDKEKMYSIFDKWPEIAKKAFESNCIPINFDNINHIVFAGMGGSGAIGDMFSSILSKSKIHLNVVKGYSLPKTVDSKTLVIVVSVSGNTAETMSVLDGANKIGSKIIAFTSGGKMQEYCIENQIEYRIIEQLHSPRASFTLFLYTILKVLHLTLDIKKSDILESIKELDKTKKEISSLNLTSQNPALNLAKWIKNIPVIYYPYGLESAAIRFKNSLQENAKSHAMTEDIIEICHNGVVCWERKSEIHPIIIEGKNDHVKTKERWKILKEYFNLNEINYWEISSTEGSILTKLINLIYLLDYATIYLSILNEIDPSPVKSIEFIKKKL